MIVIYTKQVTNRLKYVLDFIFNNYFKLTYRITTEANFSDEECVISYGLKPEKGIYIQSNHLLFQTTIEPQIIEFVDWGDTKVFFSVPNSILPFDIFSAIFYLLSRYEEYLHFEPDEHGRFSSQLNVLVKNKLEKTPIIELWLLKFRAIFLNHYKGVQINKQQYTLKCTIDVDHIYAYKGKSFFVNLGGFIKRPFQSINRFKTVFGLSPDPFDHFDWLNETHAKYKITPLFFLLLSNQGKYNSQTNINGKPFKRKIKDLQKQNITFGIHPSYHFLEVDKANKEIDKFENVFFNKPTFARGHFLRIQFPFYFQKLMQLGIFEDYSIGFSDINGFRSGISKPHLFFDLINNYTTNLKLFPFCIADHVDRFYLKRSPHEILNEYSSILQSLYDIGGDAVVLFHNDTFLTPFWKKIYIQILDFNNKKAN